MTEEYQKNVSLLKRELDTLSMDLEENRNDDLVQDRFKRARFYYKKIEYFIEYFYIKGTQMYNAANLMDYDHENYKVVYPYGFQVIEEFLFPEVNWQEKKQVLLYLRILKDKAVAQLVKLPRANKNYLTDAHFILALRFELQRLMALGITGFDSPLALNSIPEAVAVLESMQTILQLYNRADPRHVEIFSRAQDTLAQTLAFLAKNTNFDEVDRFGLIRDYLLPLGENLLDIQKIRWIGFPQKFPRPFYESSVNYVTEVAFDMKKPHLFAQNAINTDYFQPIEPFGNIEKQQELGKILFFDPILSANNQRACASCHHVDKAMTDGLIKSTAFDFHGSIARNAPTILNAIFQRSIFYDTRINTLYNQSTSVIISEKEFASSFKEIIEKLGKSPGYTALFKSAFQKHPHFQNSINADTIRLALAEFGRTLTSLDSKFDRAILKKNEGLTEKERQGFNIYAGKGKCATCHFIPLMNGSIPPYYTRTEAEVIGVTTSPDPKNPVLDPDVGKYSLYRVPFHKFAFKTPTVRNIELTAPYMHNGAFESLEEIVEFYNDGGGVGRGLKLSNQTLLPDLLNLTDQEQTALVAFMKTLTDTNNIPALPKSLPEFPAHPEWNRRTIGGDY